MKYLKFVKKAHQWVVTEIVGVGKDQKQTQQWFSNADDATEEFMKNQEKEMAKNVIEK